MRQLWAWCRRDDIIDGEGQISYPAKYVWNVPALLQTASDEAQMVCCNKRQDHHSLAPVWTASPASMLLAVYLSEWNHKYVASLRTRLWVRFFSYSGTACSWQIKSSSAASYLSLHNSPKTAGKLWTPAVNVVWFTIYVSKYPTIKPDSTHFSLKTFPLFFFWQHLRRRLVSLQWPKVVSCPLILVKFN